MYNSAHLDIIANQFCFDIGCFVYYLNVLQTNLSNCKHCSKLNKVTNHLLSGSKPSTLPAVVIITLYYVNKIKPRIPALTVGHIFLVLTQHVFKLHSFNCKQ